MTRLLALRSDAAVAPGAALDKQLRELGLPVRVFGERHLDRLQRWSQEKEKRLSKGDAACRGGHVWGRFCVLLRSTAADTLCRCLGPGEEVANPNREAWMTISAEGSAEADGAAVAGEGGEGVKAAALMGSLDSLLMGTSSRSEKQQVCCCWWFLLRGCLLRVNIHSVRRDACPS